MSLTAQESAFINAVGDRIESVVIAASTQGRWLAGSSVSQSTASTLRTVLDDTSEYMIGTAIDKRNQRAMMAAQPEALRAVCAMLSAVDEQTPDALAAAAMYAARLYNKVMSLKVDEPSLTP